MENNLDEKKYKITNVILIAILIIVIGLNIYPVKDWDAVLNKEGFWYYIRIFASIIGSGIGAYSAFFIANYTFNRNKNEEENREKKKEEIERKRIVYSVGTVLGTLFLQKKELEKNLEKIDLLIKIEKVDIVRNNIFAIPSELILNIPENNLFNNLIVKNNIKDFNVIKRYSLFYKSILNCESLKNIFKDINETIFECYNKFKDDGLKKINEELINLSKNNIINHINSYWLITEDFNKSHYLDIDQYNNMKNILIAELDLLKKKNYQPNQDKLISIIDKLEYVHSNFFYALTQIRDGIIYNYNIIIRMLEDGSFLMEKCLTNQEYQEFINFLASEFIPMDETNES